MSKKHNTLRSRSYSPQSRTPQIAANGSPDTTGEEFSMKQIAAKSVNGVRDFHLNTIANWIHKGVHGRKLGYVRRGGSVFVTKTQFRKFYFGEAA